MLAVVGFVVTGILFAVFALTVKQLTFKGRESEFNHYSIAYWLLAIAFLGYGLASTTGTGSVLNIAVIFGNIILLAATLFILNILLRGEKTRKTWLIVAAVLSVAMVVLRVTKYYPTPVIDESMLFFNSPRFVSFALSSIFLLIWLPVNLRISRLVLAGAKIRQLDNIYPLAYAAATISAVIFLLSKKPHALILSFTAISLSFVMLITANIFIKYIRDEHGK